jgi:predicted HNH restriction endonuclease
MRTYQEILNSISLLLNSNVGKGKKGFNSQKEFLSNLTELKQNYNIKLSKTFLFNLMTTDKTNKQKRQKIRNLLRGVETEKKTKYSRELDLIKYEVKIEDFSYKKGYTPKKAHINREVKPLKIISTNKGVRLDYKNQKDLRENGVFVCEGDYINLNVRYQTIGKEFINTHKKNFTFIKI